MQQYAKASTSELICIPFLDSSTTASERAAIATELRRRGLGRISVSLLRILAGLGLWWNLIAWEWAHLDLYDVLFGYAINFGFVALFSAVLACFRLATGGQVLTATLVTLGSAFLGFGFWVAASRGWQRTRTNRT